MYSLQRLQRTHAIMRLWAKTFNVHSFPSSLKSLETRPPTYLDICHDFNKINEFKSHPAYLFFFTGYDGTMNHLNRHQE